MKESIYLHSCQPTYPLDVVKKLTSFVEGFLKLFFTQYIDISEWNTADVSPNDYQEFSFY